MSKEKEKLYLEDGETGIARETSHPNFVEYFSEEFYYDCSDDEAPFGNDNGADALYELEDLFKSGDYEGKILALPKRIISEIWDFHYLIPDNFSKKKIAELIEKEEYSLIATDQVIIAVALGGIKIAGEIEAELKELALNAMKRQKVVFEMLGYERSETYDIIMEDLEKFPVK